jgi:site-specific recombinase XerD
MDAKLDASAGPAAGTLAEPSLRSVSEAVERFLASHGYVDPVQGYRGDLEYATFRKYRCGLNLLKEFCHKSDVEVLDRITVENLEDYRRSRSIGLVTWKVELQTLRTFFAYCVSRKWITSNPAKELKPPRNLKPNEIVPYTLLEESRILAACDLIGGGKYHRSGARYEQLRARAMILLLRQTALRVSDVATFRKDAISWDEAKSVWRVLLRTQRAAKRFTCRYQRA